MVEDQKLPINAENTPPLDHHKVWPEMRTRRTRPDNCWALPFAARPGRRIGGIGRHVADPLSAVFPLYFANLRLVAGRSDGRVCCGHSILCLDG
jgi:hypothetical protein